MSLVLHPRLTAHPSDRIQVWLGVFERTTAPTLEWFIDGAPAYPKPGNDLNKPFGILQSVRPNNLIPPENKPHAFAGVFEFGNLNPETKYSIEVRGGAERSQLDVRTLPTTVTNRVGEWFNVLVASCYCAHNDFLRSSTGLREPVLSAIPKELTPHMSLFMGDQVYLDLPPRVFEEDADRLAEAFEQLYVKNWRDNRLSKLLSAAPGVTIADDHEYWNDFPHICPWNRNTKTPWGQKAWTKVCRALFEGFQQSSMSEPGEPIVFTIPPLSFCIADFRTFRNADTMSLLGRSNLQKVLTWTEDVAAQKYFGVFVSGQSMFQEKSDPFLNYGDHSLAAYKEYPEIIRSLNRLARSGREVLLLTGDVHWGRVTEARDPANPAPLMYEVISSPVAVIPPPPTLPFFFSSDKVWPDHEDPMDVPRIHTFEGLGGAFVCSTYRKQKGNHVAVLSFRQAGFGLDAKITYFPIHAEQRYCEPVEVSLPRLGPK